MSIRPSASRGERPVSITCVRPVARGFAGRAGRSRKSGTGRHVRACDDCHCKALVPVLAGCDNSFVAECSKCGAENPAGAKFCMECGERLERRCPECGAVAPENAKFCMDCGSTLES